MLDLIERELIYLAYYMELQLRQLFWFYVLGTLLGSFISVFAKDKIHKLLTTSTWSAWGFLGFFVAALLGFASPICMYGTLPIVAALYHKGIKQDVLACFMVASVLLNPQLIAYSLALGPTVFTLRIVTCLLMALCAGVIIKVFFRNTPFFNFQSFGGGHNHDTDPNLLLRYLKNVGRNLKATLPYFIGGMLIAALFSIHLPRDDFAELFGRDNGLGVLYAATLGVPLYLCGGGTVPILISWLAAGMSKGAAVAFMLSGPATKINNLAALKAVLGLRNFVLYLVFVLVFALVAGLITNALEFLQVLPTDSFY